MTLPRIVALLLLLTAGCASPPPTTAPAATPAPPPLREGVKNVGILIMDGLFITEFVAPFDIYKHAGEKLNVFSVSPRPGPIRSYEGVALQADYHAGDAPRIDVLVVPSGLGSMTTDLQDEALMGFVRARAGSAEWVTSHCWGAFTLAGAGLLDGRQATTFPSAVEELGARHPQLRALAGPRFVVDGRFVTSNGGLAAFEAALFVIERLLGPEEAEKIATGLVFAPENLSSARTPG